MLKTNGTKIGTANLFEVSVTYEGHQNGRVATLQWFVERAWGRNALEVQTKYLKMYGNMNPGLRVNVNQMDKFHISVRPV